MPGALSICVPSLISITISYSSGFLGFREGGYDADALAAFVAAAAGGEGDDRDGDSGRGRGRGHGDGGE